MLRRRDGQVTGEAGRAAIISPLAPQFPSCSGNEVTLLLCIFRAEVQRVPITILLILILILILIPRDLFIDPMLAGSERVSTTNEDHRST